MIPVTDLQPSNLIARIYINRQFAPQKDSVFYEVMWECGLDYKFDLNCSRYIKGVTFEEMKGFKPQMLNRRTELFSFLFFVWWENIKIKL